MVLLHAEPSERLSPIRAANVEDPTEQDGQPGASGDADNTFITARSSLQMFKAVDHVQGEALKAKRMLRPVTDLQTKHKWARHASRTGHRDAAHAKAAVRNSPEMLKELQRWWQTVHANFYTFPRSLEVTCLGEVVPHRASIVAGLDFNQYCQLYELLFKALVTPFDAARALACAEHDWDIDADVSEGTDEERRSNKHVVSQRLLFDFLFDLADTWVHGTSVDEFTTFLSMLLSSISDVLVPNDPSLSLRSLRGVAPQNLSEMARLRAAPTDQWLVRSRETSRKRGEARELAQARAMEEAEFGEDDLVALMTFRDGRPPDEAELVAILGEHRRSSKPRSAALPQPAEFPPEQAKPWSAPPPQQQQRRPSMAQLTPMGAAGSTSPRSSRRSQRVKCNVQLPTVMKSNERTGRVASKSTRPWSLAGDLGGETSEDELSSPTLTRRPVSGESRPVSREATLPPNPTPSSPPKTAEGIAAIYIPPPSPPKMATRIGASVGIPAPMRAPMPSPMSAELLMPEQWACSSPRPWTASTAVGGSPTLARRPVSREAAPPASARQRRGLSAITPRAAAPALIPLPELRDGPPHKSFAPTQRVRRGRTATEVAVQTAVLPLQAQPKVRIAEQKVRLGAAGVRLLHVYA